MSPFWGVYWAIAIGAGVWHWLQAREAYELSSIDRLLEAIAFGVLWWLFTLLWWLFLLGLGVMSACEWFDKKFEGKGR